VISGFPRGVNEICVVWLYYAALMVVSGRSFSGPTLGPIYKSEAVQALFGLLDHWRYGR